MCLSIPAKLVSVSGEDPLSRMGKVSFGGVLKEISLAYVPEARVDDFVLVHVGFAISVVDEAEAGFVFRFLEQAERDEAARAEGAAGGDGERAPEKAPGGAP